MVKLNHKPRAYPRTLLWLDHVPKITRTPIAHRWFGRCRCVAIDPTLYNCFFGNRAAMLVVFAALLAAVKITPVKQFGFTV